jgi:SAM-dependent methyltransferase
MNAPSIQPVCPDDRGELRATQNGRLCSRCGRSFPLTQNILELLPKEVFQESSSERSQLERYASTFSRREEKWWSYPLRFFLARLGNGYLYDWAADCVNAAAPGINLSVLDAGCGDGILTRFLSTRHSYVGVDFSTRLLLRAVRYHRGVYIRGDLGHLPFSDDSFDVAVSLQVLQYLRRPEEALREISRVLRKDGKLFLSLPNAESFKYRLQGTPPIQLQRFDHVNMRLMLTGIFEVQDLRTRGLWLPFPKVPLHIPGTYANQYGLSWTVVATPRK